MVPGSWPPSPGLAPCAILICSSRALTRYSLVTPKRPEATCLMALFLESPLGSGMVALRILATLAGVALAADAVHGDGQRLVRFLADRAVGHGAGLEALDDALDRLDFLDRDRIAALELQQAAQRAQVASTDRRSAARRTCTRAKLLVRTAFCSRWMASGLNRWVSPSLRHWYWPPAVSAWPLSAAAGNAARWRIRISCAMTSMPMPPMREAVQVKY